jgi:hypothetical protein
MSEFSGQKLTWVDWPLLAQGGRSVNSQFRHRSGSRAFARSKMTACIHCKLQSSIRVANLTLARKICKVVLLFDRTRWTDIHPAISFTTTFSRGGGAWCEFSDHSFESFSGTP